MSNLKDFPGNIPDRIKYTVWICIGLVAAISILDLAIWIFGWNLPESMGYYWIPMKVSASFCFLLSAISVLIIISKRTGSLERTGPVIAGVVLNITGAFTIISWGGNGEVQDGFLSNAFFLNLLFSPEQRMSLLSGYIFLFIGVIMNSMEESQKELALELDELKYRDKNSDELYRHIISRLDDLNKEIRGLKGTK